MRLIQSNLFVNSEHRAAVQNFGWLVGDRVVRLVLNVGVGFLVARHLGPRQFGALNFALAAVAVLQPMAEMGLDAIVRREFLRAPGEAPAWAAAACGLRLMGGALAAVCILLSLRFGWVAGDERVLVAILTLLLLQPACTLPELWVHAQLAARTSVMAQWISLSTGALARLALIKWNAPLSAYAVVIAGEAAFGVSLVWIGASRRGFCLGHWDGARARSLLREAWPLMLSGFATLLYLRIDILMLRRMAGAEAAGLYAAATRFTEIWFFIPVALAGSFLPALLRARELGEGPYLLRLQMFYDLNAAIGYAIAVFMTVGARWLVPAAYGGAYAAGAPVLMLHAWSLVFVFLGVARGQFLVNERYTRFYFASVAAGLLFNVVLNLLFIPRYGIWGAALATLVAQATAAWLSTFCFAPARANAWMQTRALLIPLRWFHYVRSA